MILTNMEELIENRWILMLGIAIFEIPIVWILFRSEGKRSWVCWTLVAILAAVELFLLLFPVIAAAS